ncbi:TPA: hypothetical protein QDZ34_001150 [Stenotrophomonas maltophilia]|nr:hypothetical protein [Stenotrophomonas maltophilia]HDS1025514.1 hypothetical protein [Stenotrophomonas maltophilia]HDS1029187.1 hypothetical protein [Stenotrophomonas maltophilia]HDS1033819.1 hypothetical protein [Stenotrophomonas maltophilia]
MSPTSSARLPRRPWPWGACALGLAVLAWAALLGGLLLFLSAVGSPGDGSHALQSVHTALMAAMGALVVAGLGSGVASVLAWRSRRGRVMAAVAALLLALLGLVIAVPMLLQGHDPVVASYTIWQVTGSRG